MGSCFYDEGLRFECQGCGYCCGCEPGYVFLSKGDIERMASGLGMERQAFIDTWCRIVDMGMFKMIQKVDLEDNKNLFTVSVILIAGIGGLAINFGSVTITSVACALILGIIVNALPKKKD